MSSNQGNLEEPHSPSLLILSSIASAVKAMRGVQKRKVLSSTFMAKERKKCEVKAHFHKPKKISSFTTIVSFSKFNFN